MRVSKMLRLLGLALLLVGRQVPAWAEDEFERAPILYSQSTPENPISQLQDRLDRGEVAMEPVADLGYLPALLRAAEIREMVAAHPATFELAFTAADASRIAAKNKIIVYQSIENSYPLADDVTFWISQASDSARCLDSCSCSTRRSISS